MRFFTSDIHFGDEFTLKVDARPFVSTKKFDKFILKIWNKQARKGDTIFVVGDFVDCDGAEHDGWKKTIGYVKKVKADVVLIIGNNEERIIKYFFDNDFESFKKYCLSLGFKDVVKDMEISFCGRDFFMTHKPVDKKEGVINLFGHIHRSTGIYRPFGFNIGCDNNHFRLYSEKDIMKLVQKKHEYWDKDQNLRLV